MRKQTLGFVLGLAATAGSAQTATRTTVILGAGRAGTWDTEIAVTNTDFNPVTVLITAQPDRSSCGSATCTDYAEATIPGFGTFVLPAILAAAQPTFSNAPQAVYVISPSDQKPPAVSAVAYDAGSTCGRMTTLQSLPFEEAFRAGDLYFPGVTRGGGRYANLVLTLDPAATGPKLVGVGVADASGNILNAMQFELAPGESLVFVDVVATLGVETLEGGSIQLSKFFIPNVYDFTPYAATVILMEPGRVRTVTGTRDPRGPTG